MEEVENLKEIRQEYSALRVSNARSVSPYSSHYGSSTGNPLYKTFSCHYFLQSEYHELNKLKQLLKKQESKCKKEVNQLRLKILELDGDSRSGYCVL